MAYDFHSYIADMMIAAQRARNTGSGGSADAIDRQLHDAITDAHAAGQLGDHDEFRNDVAHKLVERGGAHLYDTLVSPRV